MKSLESFVAKKNLKPDRRQSKLAPYKDEILSLYNQGYKVETIQEALASKGVKVSVRAINKFKKSLSTKNSILKTPSGSTATTQKNSQNSVQETKAEPNKATLKFLQKHQKK